MATCEIEGELYDCSFAEKYILPIYDGVDQSALATFVKESLFIVPWAGAIHLLAIALLGGSILMVDMRVLGAGLTTQSPVQIHRVVRPLTIVAVVLAILSGLTLALGELMKLYYSPPYWMKMFSLFAAILFTFGARNRAVANEGNLGVVGLVFAIASIALWLGAFAIFSNMMAQVALALLLVVLVIFAWLGRGDKSAKRPVSLTTKMISVASITMWLVTAASGRWIAFY